MFDAILKLFDRILALQTRRQAADRAFFQDYVQPVYVDFECVHKNYLESIAKYRDHIKSTKAPLDLNNTLFDLIAHDSLLSRDIRAKVHEACRAEHSLLAGDFINSIMSYLEGLTAAALPELHEQFLSCRIRNTVDDRLRRIFKQRKQRAAKQDEATLVLEEVAAELQQHHQFVTSEYMKLKKQLLPSK